ncbi:MAG TPA: hypothetical protein VHQ86_02460 [Candidatus Saccharimonadia bacterium]|nr:hypothetical protein [Candidatus Saccharimonadia bacterium]
MVCPNCHSDKIIAVQDQHFCINCGQMVPEEVVSKAMPKGKVAVQANGLPEGVKILPVGGAQPDLEKTEKAPEKAIVKSAVKAPAAKPAEPTPATAPVAVAVKAAPAPKDIPTGVHPLIQHRSRIDLAPSSEPGDEPKPLAPEPPAAEEVPRVDSVIMPENGASASSEAAPASARSKRRKPGRPKAGRLDTPRVNADHVPMVLPPPPKVALASTAAPAVTATLPVADPPLRRMSDLAPRRAGHHGTPRHKAPTDSLEPVLPPAQAAVKSEVRPPKPHRPAAHKVGVPALHYAPVMAFSLRARLRPKHVGMAALAATVAAAAVGYGVWVYLTQGFTGLADTLMKAGPKLFAQIALLAVLYYIGRSIGQAAITFGLAREADNRPVSLGRQLGVAVNTFGRRLWLDIIFGLGRLVLLAAAVALLLTGGAAWPVDASIQVGVIFAAFLLILYGFSALAIARGLAGINLTLTTHRAKTAARLGWQLFAHRLELIGPRFGALLLELLLAAPLAALAVAFIATAPAALHIEVALGAGLLALLAGSLMGAGTAAWWTALYRQIVLTDRPQAAITLLSDRQADDARRGPMALIVAISTLALTVAVILPWLGTN